jgi:hypothetical protein
MWKVGICGDILVCVLSEVVMSYLLILDILV